MPGGAGGFYLPGAPFPALFSASEMGLERRILGLNPE